MAVAVDLTAALEKRVPGEDGPCACPPPRGGWGGCCCQPGRQERPAPAGGAYSRAVLSMVRVCL